MGKIATIAIKPQVPALDTFDSKSHELTQLFFGLDLYFLACQLDAAGGDTEYYCAIAVSLFHDNTLSWYLIYCKHNSGTIPKKFDEYNNALTMQFSVIDWHKM